MKFAVFDHLDRSGPDLSRQYEDRLKLTELYEWAGFYAYHIAEHHGTPLGSAPSPGLFLAAVATHPQPAPGPARLSARPLSSAAADRRDLHARRHERRAARARRRPR